MYCLFIQFLAYQVDYPTKKDWLIAIYEAYLGYLGITQIITSGMQNLMTYYIIDGNYYKNIGLYLSILICIFTYDLIVIATAKDYKMMFHHIVGIVSLGILFALPINYQSATLLILPVELSNPFLYGYHIAQKIAWEGKAPWTKPLVPFMEALFLLSFMGRYIYLVWFTYNLHFTLSNDYWYLYLAVWCILAINTSWVGFIISKAARRIIRMVR